MKTLLIVLIVMASSLSIQAKDFAFFRSKSEVVKTYLQEHYPTARHIHQEKISDSLYHVYFIYKDREFFLDITASGKALFEEKEMEYSEVPEKIKEYIRYESLYEYGVIIETHDHKIFYFVEIHEGKYLGEYIFDEQGNMLKRDFI
jgi:hypothetical protein